MPDDEPDYVGDALAASHVRHPDRESSSRSGTTYVGRPTPGTTPTFLILAGVATLVVGMLVSLGGSGFAVAGAIIGVVGSVIAAIGVVAAGVRLGAEWADYDRATRGS